MKRRVLHTRRGRLLLVLGLLAAVGGVLVWHVPDLEVVERAFREVRWHWVAAAIGINLLSVAFRAIAWHITINQAIAPPHPKHRHVFSGFSVGLLGNALLPGRVGEVARVAVLAPHLPHGRASWAPLFGSTVAHRIFDVVPTIGLVIYVLVAAELPGFVQPGVAAVIGVGLVLLGLGIVLGRRNRRRHSLDGLGRLRAFWHMSLRGLRVLHRPGPALAAAFFQILGWGAQLAAIYVGFWAFQIDGQPLAAAALVLLAVNVALAFPLWPGSVGLYQAAVALALVPYGIAYRHGFAFGIGLQAIEMAVGIGLGLLFLAREGLTFAMLKQIPRVTDEQVEESLEDETSGREAVRPAA